MTDRELLERGAVFFSLPPGDKASPPTGITGKFVGAKLSKADRERVRQIEKKPNDNRGLLLGHRRIEMPDGSFRGVFVLDVDNKPSRTTPDGRQHKAQYGNETLARLERELGPLPRTLTSKTPGEGAHRIFWAPSTVFDLPAKLLAKPFGDQCGVDVLTEGRYIVFPGSSLSPEIAAAKGYVAGLYEWEDPDASIAELPIKWVDYLLKLAGGAASQQAGAAPIEEPDYLARVPQAQREADAATYANRLLKSGAGDGSGQLVKVAASVAVGFGCGVDAAVRVISAAPFAEGWDEDGIRKRCEDASRAQKIPLGCMYANALPADLASPPAPAPEAARPLTSIGERLDAQRAKTPAAPVPEAPAFASKIKKGTEWNEPYVRPVYLVDTLIPKETICTFFAEGGSVKSWSALALAISVATGTPWLGRYAVVQGKVLILDFEDGWGEFRRRKEILTGRRELDLSQLEYLHAGPDITKQELWKYIASQGYTLVVIDALNSGMPRGLNENEQSFADPLKDVGTFVEETGINVLVVHHANKNGSMRGASNIRDQNDVVFKFEPVSEADDVKRMRMVCDKPGPQKRPSPVNVELSDRGLSTFEDAPANQTVQASDTLPARARLVIEQRGSIAGTIELASALGVPEKQARPVLRALVEAGEVVKGRDRRTYWADEASQRKRVLAEVKRHGDRIYGLPELAKRAAASHAVIEDMLAENLICRSSTGANASFFVVRPAA